MFLSELKIKGYKVFDSEFTIKLNKGLTVLIGENGCGKPQSLIPLDFF